MSVKSDTYEDPGAGVGFKAQKSPAPKLTEPDLYINRDLSWLKFNDRVLDQATQGRYPLLERARFVTISETNLGEFFMTRVAGLKQQVHVGIACTPQSYGEAWSSYCLETR